MRAPESIIIAVFITALSVTSSTLAQEITTEAEPVEETPPPETSLSAGEPIFPTSPDDASPVAGGRFGAPQISTELPFGRFLQLSGSLIEGYDDNVNNTPTGSDSASSYTSVSAALIYLLHDPRTQLDVDASTGITYYWSSPGGRDYDPNLHLRALLSHKLTERLTLDLNAFASYQSQPDFSTQFTVNSRSGSYFRSLDAISLSYKWTPRFSSTTRYSFALLETESSAASSQDRVENSFGQQFRFLLLPTTAVLGNYRYSMNEFGSGSRESTSQFFSLGVDQTFSKRLKATGSAGVQFRSSDTGGDRTAPYLEAVIDYALGDRAVLTWANRYSIEESDVSTASGRTTFRTHLEARYNLTARISAELLLSYFHGENEDIRNFGGSSSSQNTFDIAPTLRYAINDHFSVNVGYRHTEVDRGADAIDLGGTELVGSFSRNRYFAGLTFKF